MPTIPEEADPLSEQRDREWAQAQAEYNARINNPRGMGLDDPEVLDKELFQPLREKWAAVRAAGPDRREGVAADWDRALATYGARVKNPAPVWKTVEASGDKPAYGYFTTEGVPEQIQKEVLGGVRAEAGFVPKSPWTEPIHLPGGGLVRVNLDTNEVKTIMQPRVSVPLSQQKAAAELEAADRLQREQNLPAIQVAQMIPGIAKNPAWIQRAGGVLARSYQNLEQNQRTADQEIASGAKTPAEAYGSRPDLTQFGPNATRNRALVKQSISADRIRQLEMHRARLQSAIDKGNAPASYAQAVKNIDAQIETEKLFQSVQLPGGTPWITPNQLATPSPTVSAVTGQESEGPYVPGEDTETTTAAPEIEPAGGAMQATPTMKAQLANQIAQRHPDWSRQDIIDEVNRQLGE